MMKSKMPSVHETHRCVGQEPSIPLGALWYPPLPYLPRSDRSTPGVSGAGEGRGLQVVQPGAHGELGGVAGLAVHVLHEPWLGGGLGAEASGEAGDGDEGEFAASVVHLAAGRGMGKGGGRRGAPRRR